MKLSNGVLKKNNVIPFFDKKILFEIAIVVLVIFLGGSIGSIGVLLYALFLILKGRDDAFKAYILIVLLAIINSKLESDSNIAGLLKQLILFVANIVTIARYNSNKNLVLVKKTILYTLVLLLLSFIYSALFTISFLKIILFSTTVISIFILSDNVIWSKKYWLNYLYQVFLVIIILSIPTLFIPSIGYEVNGRGFQGVSVHPQTFTIFLAPFVAFSLGLFFFKKTRNIWEIIFLLLSIVFIFLTKGRTGVVALISSFALIAIISYFSKSKKLLNQDFIKKTFFFVLSVILVFLFFPNSISKKTSEFIFKSADSSSIQEAMDQSRGALVEEQLMDFKTSPIGGIGFGISNDLSVNSPKIVRDPFFNIPISVPLEKGIFITAILSETGIIGFLFFLFFLFSILLKVFKENNLIVCWVTYCVILTNIGESTFFSMNGFGLLIWIIIGISLMKDKNIELIK